MAGARFEMSSNFERDMEKMAQSATEGIARDLERTLADLGRRYRGRPTSEIKPVLRRDWRKVDGGDITDPDLNQYAQNISDGVKIEVRAAQRSSVV